jgi:hypothetical protein
VQKAMKAQRKTHKERSQPAKRKKLGLLEKRGEVLLPWLAYALLPCGQQ